MAEPHKLTPKQERFCTEYLVDLNATQAAIRSGYSQKTAGKIGFENIHKPEIQTRLSVLRAELAETTGITPARVLKELSRIAFSDPRRVMSWGPGGVALIPSGELSDDDAAMVSEVSESTTKDGGSLRVKLHDKLSAIEKIMRHLGMGANETQPINPGSTGGFRGTLEDILIQYREITLNVKAKG